MKRSSGSYVWSCDLEDLLERATLRRRRELGEFHRLLQELRLDDVSTSMTISTLIGCRGASSREFAAKVQLFQLEQSRDAMGATFAANASIASRDCVTRRNDVSNRDFASTLHVIFSHDFAASCLVEHAVSRI